MSLMYVVNRGGVGDLRPRTCYGDLWRARACHTSRENNNCKSFVIRHLYCQHNRWNRSWLLVFVSECCCWKMFRCGGSKVWEVWAAMSDAAQCRVGAAHVSGKCLRTLSKCTQCTCDFNWPQVLFVSQETSVEAALNGHFVPELSIES